jgi:membrane protein implicated in regulation of membrane protease activity
MPAVWLEWYYVIYWLPAAVAILVLLASGLAGHDGAQGHGADAHADLALHGGPLHSHFAGAAHSHVHVHHEGPHHGDAHADADHQGSVLRMLGFFGVGRAPITIVVGSLMMGWGLFGLGATAVLKGLAPNSIAWIPVALAAAGAGALITAKVFGELTARLMPGDESFAISREDLIGLTGVVIYPVTETLGRVHVWDRNRTLHAESARLADPGAPLPRGAEVLLTGMDPTGRYILVRPTAAPAAGDPTSS